MTWICTYTVCKFDFLDSVYYFYHCLLSRVPMTSLMPSTSWDTLCDRSITFTKIWFSASWSSGAAQQQPRWRSNAHSQSHFLQGRSPTHASTNVEGRNGEEVRIKTGTLTVHVYIWIYTVVINICSTCVDSLHDISRQTEKLRHVNTWFSQFSVLCEVVFRTLVE